MIEVVDDHDLGLKQAWRLGVFNTRGLGLFLVSHKKIGENRGKHRNLISSKISKVIYHYFRIGCGTLFWGCMGVLYAETAQAVNFFVRITSPGLVTSILSPMVHSTMRPVSRTNHEMAVTKSRLRT